MNKYQRLAWARLKEDEKMAVTLTLSNSKSTWEAGEIMGKSHYKFIEIKQRAMAFMKLFAYHYQTFRVLIPEEVSMNPTIKEYLLLTIEKRLMPHEAVKIIANPIFQKLEHREKMMRFEFDKWRYSKNPFEKAFFQFLLEFDRWNNHRILPKTMQEPHAFKRRNKNYLLQYIRAWGKQDSSYRANITQLIKASKKIKTKGFIVLIHSYKQEDFTVLRVDYSDEITQKICYDNRYFIFSTREEAKYIGKILIGYFYRDYKHCRDGLYFWADFRDKIQKALNYKKIVGVIEERPAPLIPDEDGGLTRTYLEKARKNPNYLFE